MCPILCFMNSSTINYGILNSHQARKLVGKFKIKWTSCFYPMHVCNNNGSIGDKRVDHDDGIRFLWSIANRWLQHRTPYIHIRMWYFIVLIYWRIFQWREALKSNPSQLLHRWTLLLCIRDTRSMVIGDIEIYRFIKWKCSNCPAKR